MRGAESVLTSDLISEADWEFTAFYLGCVLWAAVVIEALFCENRELFGRLLI